MTPVAQTAVVQQPRNPLTLRGFVVLGICAYVIGFEWMYRHWLSDSYGYFGFDYAVPPSFYLFLVRTFFIVPSLWMPVSLGRPSQLAYWVLYVTVFIPSMLVPLYAAITPPAEATVFAFVFLAGFAIAGFSYLFPLARTGPPRVSSHLLWFVVGGFGFALAAWIVVLFHGNLRLVSLSDVYGLRSEADALMEGSHANYALMWLSGAINPMVMAWGLYHRRITVFLVGAAGQILVYMALATKGSILSIVIIIVFYYTIRNWTSRFGPKMAMGAASLVGLLCCSYMIAGGDDNPLYSMFLFLTFFRTLSVNGLLSAWYYDFFSHNPQTQYSQVTGVNWFLQYPYSNPIGVEIGAAYSNDPTHDASAHFWATDGLAAAGLPGVILISFLCAFVFWVLDSASQRHDARLAALVICYAAYNLANISIFTSLLSGGL